MDFARLWTGGAEPGVPSADDDVSVLGGKPAPKPREEPFTVIDNNWEAVDVFMASRTQWRVGFHGRTGLDYPAVISVMNAFGVQDTADCLRRITVIETEALNVWDERRAT